MTKITREDYVAAVLALPRERVTAVYSDLYETATGEQWPLSDGDVTRFAEQDFHDGPGNRAFDEILIAKEVLA